MAAIAKLNMPLLLQNLKKGRFMFMYTRATHSEAKPGDIQHIRRSPNKPSLLERLKSELAQEKKSNPSIYKVPKNLRQVETNAYEPNIISIGPYHHGKPRLQAMEKVKWQFFRRLFNPEERKDAELENVVKAIEVLENEARSCYSEDCRMSSDKFIDMMIIDGCFIIELFREVEKARSRNQQLPQVNNKLFIVEYFKKQINAIPKDQRLEKCTLESAILKRWMLPVLRQDLIMLENQLPLSVLCKLFELTEKISNFSSNNSLQELVLGFFSPLMAKITGSSQSTDSNNNGKYATHLLDLFRSSILPGKIERGEERYIFHSLAELKETGIKVRKEMNGQPLDISFQAGVLKIPPFCIDDYKCTLYRNMVAFEQCHKACKPDVTRYLFFLDGLINSAKDVELLHYAGIMQHSLGNNKQVARTVNKLCKEVSQDMEESYLYEVVNGINEFCDKILNRNRAYAAHNYFTNIWVATSTVAAIFLLYLTVLQTCFSLAQIQNSSTSHFWFLLAESLLFPFPSSVGYVMALAQPMVEPMEFVVWHYI